jgi:transposase
MAYPSEFRQKILELLETGRSKDSLAREYGISDNTIRSWVAQAQIDVGLRDEVPTSGERAEIRRLKRQIRQLKFEQEILAKATAWFAREAGSAPRKHSSS